MTPNVIAPPRPQADRRRAKRTSVRPTILLLSPSGWGNLGDAAIVDATIAGIRRRWPDARIVGVTLSSGDTEERHGIEGFLLAGRSLSGYGMIPHPRRKEPVLSDVHVRGAVRLARTFPKLARQIRFVSDVILTARAEPGHTRAARALVEDADLVIIAGGGQLDEFWGGAWGHPFALYKWSRLAERAGVPIAFLSVGVCEMETPLARWFIRRALERADYRSYRDGKSSGLVERLGLRGEHPVVPDLAFAVDLPEPPAPVASGARRRVGISPMGFRDPRVWPVHDPIFFRAYVQSMAELVTGLATAGCEVSLYTTDPADRLACADVLNAVPEHLRGSIEVEEGSDLRQLLRYLGTLDLAIASRLHGLLLAVRAGRPVMALPYDRKVDTLMTDLGLSEFTMPITDVTSNDALAIARSALERLPEMHSKVQRLVDDYSTQVDAQFEAVLGSGGLLRRV